MLFGPKPFPTYREFSAIAAPSRRKSPAIRVASPMPLSRADASLGRLAALSIALLIGSASIVPVD